jgi:chromate transport protein ChrA
MKIPVATVSGKLPQSNSVKNFNIYAKDYPKNGFIKGMLISVMVIIIIIIIYCLLRIARIDLDGSKLFTVILSIFKVLLLLTLLILSMVGITTAELKNTDRLNIQNRLSEFNININKSNINKINELLFPTFLFALFSSVSGLSAMMPLMKTH